MTIFSPLKVTSIREKNKTRLLFFLFYQKLQKMTNDFKTSTSTRNQISELALEEKIKVDKTSDAIFSGVRIEIKEIFNMHIEKLTWFY